MRLSSNKSNIVNSSLGLINLFAIAFLFAPLLSFCMASQTPQAKIQMGNLELKNIARSGDIDQKLIKIEKTGFLKIPFSGSEDSLEASLDSMGRIYLLNKEQAMITVFDKEGKVLYRFGRKGEGPNELLYPMNFLITLQDNILIKDKVRFQVNIFSLEGKLLRIIPFDIQNLGQIRVDSRGNIIGDLLSLEGGKALLEINRYDKKFNLIKRLISIDITKVFEHPELLYFGKYLSWELLSDDKIVIGFSDKYHFFLYSSDGQLLKEFIREFKPDEILAKEREKEMSWAHPSAKEAISKMKYHKAFKSFWVTGRNRIIVRTWKRTIDNAEYYFDAINSDGVFMGRFSGKFSIIALKNDNFLAAEQLLDGKLAINFYKIIWE